MRLISFTLAAALLGAAPAVVAAEIREAGAYRLAITPIVGYRMSSDFTNDDEDAGDIGLDDDAVFGVIFNAPYQSVGGDAYTEWEFYYSHQSVGVDEAPASVDPDLDLDIDYFLIGGTYVGEGQSVRPYLAAEIGAAHFNPDGEGYDDDTVFAFSIGGGAQVSPAKRVGLRLEGRVLGAVMDSDSSLFCRSGSSGTTCAFRSSGDVLWQWEVSAGATFRF